MATHLTHEQKATLPKFLNELQKKALVWKIETAFNQRHSNEAMISENYLADAVKHCTQGEGPQKILREYQRHLDRKERSTYPFNNSQTSIAAMINGYYQHGFKPAFA